MSTEIKVPVLPESVSDATIAAWHKKPGDTVTRDENLVDIETDKVVLEVVAQTDGVLGSVSKQVGDLVTAEEVIGQIEAAGAAPQAPEVEAPKPAAAPAPTPAPAPAPATAAPAPVAAKVAASTPEPSTRRSAAPSAATPEPASRHSSPAARRREQQLANGAATTKPVPAAPQLKTQVTKTPLKKAPKSPAVAASPAPGSRPEERVPMSRLRARIAERLLSAQQNAAILTTFNEINMKPVMDLRAKYKDQFAKTHDVKLGFMSFFTKAVIEALKRYPAVNASIDGNDVVYHGFYDIGVAVSSPRGLVVPVLRDVDQMSLADVERSIKEMGERAQNGTLGLEDMTGGTFTISNGGVFGSLMSTPILNPPQTGILGMHKIEERPVVENGEIVIRPMMYVALSYDHRLIDGKDSVSFLVTIKELLEDPARMLLAL